VWCRRRRSESAPDRRSLRRWSPDGWGCYELKRPWSTCSRVRTAPGDARCWQRSTTRIRFDGCSRRWGWSGGRRNWRRPGVRQVRNGSGREDRVSSRCRGRDPGDAVGDGSALQLSWRREPGRRARLGQRGGCKNGEERHHRAPRRGFLGGREHSLNGLLLARSRRGAWRSAPGIACPRPWPGAPIARRRSRPGRTVRAAGRTRRAASWCRATSRSPRRSGQPAPSG